MKKVVITGGSGFVGANLARKLLKSGHEVHLLVRKNYHPWRLQGIAQDLHIHKADLGDIGGLKKSIAGIKPQWIFHLGVYGAYSYQDDPGKILQTNVLGTANLMEAALKTGFQAFINTGSSSEYGFKNEPFCETDRLQPNSYYAASKAAATLFCSYSAVAKNAGITTLRLFSVYGPYEEPARLVPTLLVYGLKGKFPDLVNPATARDYVYVDDVTEAYILAAEKIKTGAGEIYNLGTGVQTSIREIVALARKILKIKARPEWGTLPARIWDSNFWVADNRKIKRELAWRPRTGLEQGFKQTLKWLQDNPRILDFYQKQLQKRRR
ncbi:MAG: GDP-mannose 4,6-dehydratase [Candidatus Omnitrophica bacterium]|nr:GDP-mannose 4,6-dehydratase [Candidatus Omnitrophota bacterium]